MTWDIDLNMDEDTNNVLVSWNDILCVGMPWRSHITRFAKPKSLGNQATLDGNQCPGRFGKFIVFWVLCVIEFSNCAQVFEGVSFATSMKAPS